MTEWADVFLGVIAAATLLMALMQIAAVVVAAKLARQAQEAVRRAQATLATAEQTLTSVRDEVRPLLTQAAAIASDASKTAALASAQAGKIDRLVTDLVQRADQTSLVVQQAILTPAREGLALVAGLRAALGVVRDARDWRRRPSRSEEEDPLFIG